MSSNPFDRHSWKIASYGDHTHYILSSFLTVDRTSQLEIVQVGSDWELREYSARTLTTSVLGIFDTAGEALEAA